MNQNREDINASREEERHAIWQLAETRPWEVVSLEFLDEETERALVQGWRNAGVKALSPQSQRLYACDCIEHVLPLYKQVYPDGRVIEDGLEMSRRLAVGETSNYEVHRFAKAIERVRSKIAYQSLSQEQRMSLFFLWGAFVATATDTQWQENFLNMEDDVAATLAAKSASEAVYLAELHESREDNKREQAREEEWQAKRVLWYLAEEHPEYGLEGRVGAYATTIPPGKYRAALDVYKNPTAGELKQELKNANGALRGLLTDEDVYIWDASGAIHMTVAEHLGLAYNDIATMHLRAVPSAKRPGYGLDIFVDWEGERAPRDYRAHPYFQSRPELGRRWDITFKDRHEVGAVSYSKEMLEALLARNGWSKTRAAQELGVSLESLMGAIKRHGAVVPEEFKNAGRVTRYSKEAVEQALERNDWNQVRAAKEIGMTQGNLSSYMKKHGIVPPEDYQGSGRRPTYDRDELEAYLLALDWDFAEAASAMGLEEKALRDMIWRYRIEVPGGTRRWNEKKYNEHEIKDLLDECGWQYEVAAKRMGLAPSTLRGLVNRYRIRKDTPAEVGASSPRRVTQMGNPSTPVRRNKKASIRALPAPPSYIKNRTSVDVTLQEKVGAKRVAHKGDATQEQISRLAKKDPSEAIKAPAISPKLFYDLAEYHPVEATLNPAFEMLTLEDPARWTKLLHENVENWLDKAQLFFDVNKSNEENFAFSYDCINRVWPIYEKFAKKKGSPWTEISKARNILRLYIRRGASHEDVTTAEYSIRKLHAQAMEEKADPPTEYNKARLIAMQEVIAVFADAFGRNVARVAYAVRHAIAYFVYSQTHSQKKSQVAFAEEAIWQWSRAIEYVKGAAKPPRPIVDDTGYDLPDVLDHGEQEDPFQRWRIGKKSTSKQLPSGRNLVGDFFEQIN